MKKSILFLLSIVFLIISCDKKAKVKIDFTTLFETSKGTETPEYNEIIEYYTNLADEYNEISLFSFGQTDSGEPLHLVVYNKSGIYNCLLYTSPSPRD